MKLSLVLTCAALLFTTVVCVDDDISKLLLDENMMMQYSPITQIMNGLASKPSYDCEAYCNGVKVTDLETPSCNGVFYIECTYKFDKVEGKSCSSCVGAFKRTKTSDVAEVTCDGVWHSHSADTIHVHSKDACKLSGQSCGGKFDVKYNLLPYDGALGAEEQQVNYTCKGTESCMHEMSKDMAESVQVENVGDLAKAIDDYFLKEYSFKPLDTDEEFDVTHADLKHHYHHDCNCTATCGEEPVDPTAAQVCTTEFDESCSGKFKDYPFKFTQACSGTYAGYPGCAEACLGRYTWDWSSDEAGCAGYCTKAFGFKMVEGHKGVGTFQTCFGESFAAVKYPEVPEPQAINLAEETKLPVV